MKKLLLAVVAPLFLLACAEDDTGKKYALQAEQNIASMNFILEELQQRGAVLSVSEKTKASVPQDMKSGDLEAYKELLNELLRLGLEVLQIDNRGDVKVRNRAQVEVAVFNARYLLEQLAATEKQIAQAGSN